MSGIEDLLLGDAASSELFGHTTYALHGPQGAISKLGAGTARLLGRDEAGLIGLCWSDPQLGAMLPGGRPLSAERDPGVVATMVGSGELETVSFVRPDGSRVWVSIRAALVRVRSGDSVVSSLTDVTELVEALEARTRLATIVEATSDVIGSFRADGSCTWLNPSAERTLGVCADEFDLFDSLGDTAREFRADVLGAVHQFGRWSGELVIRTPRRPDRTGRDIHLAANVISDFDGDGRRSGWTLVGHDFTEHKAMQAVLAHKATHDTLTSLPNRALLNETMAARARSGVATTIVFVDLDGFKQLNDTFGHEFGDDALVDVARRIAAAVGPNGFAARFGGDEFVIIPDPAWDDPVAELDQRVFTEPFTVGPIILDITGRMGIATAEPGESSLALIARADREMYRAKRTRRSDDVAR